MEGSRYAATQRRIEGRRLIAEPWLAGWADAELRFCRSRLGSRPDGAEPEHS